MMNTENIEQTKPSSEQVQTDVQVDIEETLQYKRVLSAADAEENAQPVDFRRVQHGHGPCACCGPYSE
ncbi:hypothetical protein [Herminiimonas fonticola]|uniref:Uncharacterized protein n=1 Tax=Herminiimonas fonticola TaxID=303380 RepID=A0A4R6GHA7_9BURK|nr:hypothetical protein [Herminiimonas fonticola]RBA25197.1 hypothetical protein Hfont_0830 [Herminiimonas fonticola]TDN94312.1 hypothetical protein EV677_0855 [Herminiimonas fonticola]